MHARIVVFIAVSALLTPSQTTKWLLDNPGFDNPTAWVSEYLPCSLEEVVFPKDYSALLPLPAFVDVAGFTLPDNGALLLNSNSVIQLGGERRGQRPCKNGNSHKAYIRKPTPKKWFDPNSWRSTALETRDSALPHMERVPCNNDSVVIEDKGAIALDLEGVQYLRVGLLNLTGSLLSRDYLLDLINSDIGQTLFKHNSGVRVEYHHRDDECGCHKDAADFVEPICHNVGASCALPHCLVPVLPYESCCPICGAVLQFSMSQCSDGPLHKLRQTIATAIAKEELNDQLDYHVNYVDLVSSGSGLVLQAIIVDRDDYEERSVDFASRLNVSTNWTKLFDTPQRLEMRFSGRSYNPNISFGSVLLILLCLLLMTVVGVVGVAHYAPDSRHLRNVPRWLYDTRHWRQLLHSPFVFARFDNGAASCADENLTMGFDAARGEVREQRAFDNPMFGEVPPTAVEVQVERGSGASAKNMTANVAVKLECGSLLVDGLETGTEEQELTEIKLGSCDSDDDVQLETTK